MFVNSFHETKIFLKIFISTLFYSLVFSVLASKDSGYTPETSNFESMEGQFLCRLNPLSGTLEYIFIQDNSKESQQTLFFRQLSAPVGKNYHIWRYCYESEDSKEYEIIFHYLIKTEFGERVYESSGTLKEFVQQCCEKKVSYTIASNQLITLDINNDTEQEEEQVLQEFINLYQIRHKPL